LTINLPAIAALTACLVAAPAVAAEITIENLSAADVVSVSTDPGEIADFRRVAAGTTRSFEIEMPQGVCESEVEISFSDGSSTGGTTDVCEGGGIRLTEEY
jgi:hypothetical protein